MVGVLDLLIRIGASPGTEHRRQTGDARSVSGAVAAVDVVAAGYDARKFLRDVVELVGRLRAAEHAERLWPGRFDRVRKTAGCPVEGFIPCGDAQIAAVSHHRLRQPKRCWLHA